MAKWMKLGGYRAGSKRGSCSVAIGCAAVLVAGLGPKVRAQGSVINLPTSKQLAAPAPGDPQRLNSLPMALAVSPDGRWVVSVNAGYGTFESRYDQSLAVMDTATGKVVDFPDDRTGMQSKQSLYSGLAFSGDGRHLYAGMASMTEPVGDGKEKLGNGVLVYGFSEGKIVPERMLPIGLQALAGGRRTKLIGSADGNKGVPFPAGIAVVAGASGERLLVADNLSDDALLMDAATGKVLARFDLSESDTVPGTYPLGVAVTKDGTRGFVTLWNASEVVELDLVKGKVGRKLELLKPKDPLKPGTHPSDLAMSPDGKTLYIALANRDAVAALDVSSGVTGEGAEGKFQVKGYFDTRLPGQSYFGAQPNAVAVNADGSRLYVGNMSSDAVAVMDTRKLTAATAKQGMVEPVGFMPTEWMPMSMAFSGGRLYVATAKGKGTGPNNFAQRQLPDGKGRRPAKFSYIGTLLYGSLAVVDAGTIEAHLPGWTATVLESNRMKAQEEKIAFAGGGDRIKHVLYIIKENRTYDQILGDLAQGGRPVGNGDPSLTMYGAQITPNEHKLALQFGVLDNFFDSGEVSGDGHQWSNAAITSDYNERTWQQNYRNGQRGYDFEGVVAEGYPLLQKIPDVDDPASGFMWGNAEAHGKTHYNFGEFIASTFCDEKKSESSQAGPMLAGAACKRDFIKPGEAIPEEWGGGVNKGAWPIPLMRSNVATKPELVGHFAEESPDFNLRVPDQIRAEVFLRHMKGWIADRAAGRDTMPAYITMRLGNDHTSGTTPGGPTPKSLVADNDLAVGRIVEAVSHSAFWDDTAVFILEDDAQNGGDHVDAHRSVALVVSKYAPHGAEGAAFVDSRFYSTVSVVRTMETLLGLPPMNNNDAFAPMISTLFAGAGDQPAFVADVSNRENGLIYTANKANAPGAAASRKMDFRHEDRVDSDKLNLILWKDAMGSQKPPAMLLVKHARKKDSDDQ